MESGEQTFLQQFDFSECLLLQVYGAKPYFWKLQKQLTEYSVVDKSSLSLLIQAYIQKFTQTRRAKDKEIRSLTEQFVSTIKSYFRNLKIDFSQFFSFALRLHDQFHSNLIDLQRDTATKVLSESKKKFHFTPLLSRFLLKDVVLEEREGEFMTNIIEIEQFNQDKLRALFLSKFQDFITGYSLDKEDVILDIISKALKNYVHSENELLDRIVGMLKTNLQETVNSLKPTKTLLLMLQLPDTQESISHWELVTEVVFDNEEIELKQVIPISESGVLATLSLKQSNVLLLVFGQNFFATICETDIKDHNTIICEGSNQNNLIYFSNTSKKCVLAYEQENKLIIKKEIPYNINGLDSVKSAVLIQKNVVGLLNQDGNFLLFALEGKNDSVDPSQVCLKTYNRISLSQCRSFISLSSGTEVFVFNNKLELMILDYGSPVFSFVIDGTLVCIEKQEEGNTVVRRVDYPFGYERAKGKSNYAERISFEYQKTMQFGKSLLTDIMKDNKFVSHYKK